MRARNNGRPTRLPRLLSFSIYRLHFNAPGIPSIQGEVVASILVDSRGEVVGFQRRHLAPCEDDDPADRELTNQILDDFDEAWDRKQLTGVWNDEIRHLSNTISLGEVESIDVADLSSAEVLLDLALTKLSVQPVQNSRAQGVGR